MTPDPYAIPEAEPLACHVDGSLPEGYEGDEGCTECLQKFTCLPAAAAKPEVWTSRGVRPWAVEDDHEVVALLDRQMTYDEIEQRISDRFALISDDEVVPPELLVRKVAPGDRRPSRRIARSGGKLPAPRAIPEETMERALGQVRLGKRIEWEYGMQIVRRMRARDENDQRIEHTVTVTRNGFLYDGKLYSSLSAAAQNASGTPCRSGNDWFNLRTSGCTEVRGADGSVVASRTVGS